MLVLVLVLGHRTHSSQPYIPPPMCCIGIASASQRDHWHGYRFHFEGVLARKLLSLAAVRHGLLEKHKSATGVCNMWPLQGDVTDCSGRGPQHLPLRHTPRCEGRELDLQCFAFMASIRDFPQQPKQCLSWFLNHSSSTPEKLWLKPPHRPRFGVE